MRVVAARRPGRGQVWAFCDEAGHVVVHRCRRRQGDAFAFRGDAEARRDAPVPADRLIGRVAAVAADGRVRRLGTWDRLLGSLPGELVRRRAVNH